MTAPESRDAQSGVEAALAAHFDPEGWTWNDAENDDDDRLAYECECGDRMVLDAGVTAISPEDCDAAARWHVAHVAAVIEPVLAAERARALREAIDDHQATFGVACSTSRAWLRERVDSLSEPGTSSVKEVPTWHGQQDTPLPASRPATGALTDATGQPSIPETTSATGTPHGDDDGARESSPAPSSRTLRDLRGAILVALMENGYAAEAGKVRAVVMRAVSEALAEAWDEAIAEVNDCPGGWVYCTCTPRCGTNPYRAVRERAATDAQEAAGTPSRGEVAPGAAGDGNGRESGGMEEGA